MSSRSSSSFHSHQQPSTPGSNNPPYSTDQASMPSNHTHLTNAQGHLNGSSHAQPGFGGGHGHGNFHGGLDTRNMTEPILTSGERIGCIVNSSITCVSSALDGMNGFPSFPVIKRNGSRTAMGQEIPSVPARTRAGHHRQPSLQDESNAREKDLERLRLYVFGGFHQYTDAVNNDLYRLDIETMIWEKLIYTKGKPPSKRNDHSASLWGDDRIVIFGGSDETNQYCSDIHILHVRTLTWETPDIGGIIPVGRVKHSATIVDDKLYISGGCLEKEGVSQDLLCLDLQRWEWEEPVDFVARYTHTLFVYHNKLFAYGGYNEEMDRTGIIAYVDLTTHQVTKINVANDIAPNVAAQQFSQVCGHQLVVVISQGLRHELQKFTGGIWTLDLDCFQWTKHNDWKIMGENHTWHYFAMDRDSEQFYLIGDVNESDEYFQQVLTVDLREYGSFQEPLVTIGNEFGRLLQSQMALADFRIVCNGGGVSSQGDGQGSSLSWNGYQSASDAGSEGGEMMIDSQPISHHQRRAHGQTPSMSRAQSPQHEPILCHRLILMARWPHFANMVHSGMLEAQTSTLTLPEPYETVRGFIDFLYTDTIEGLPTDIVADLLVMGSMYVMKRLVQLCGSALHQQIDIETVSRIYHRAGQSGQVGLRQRALKFMFKNYGPVSKTVGFRSLPKEALFDFWDSTPEGAVINVSL